MKRALVLVLIAMVAVACTHESGPSSTQRLPAPAETAQASPPRDAKIYAAVIRQLVTKDHTFGRGVSPFKVVYVVNGAVTGAGEPRGNLFGPARDPFSPAVVDGIRQALGNELPPLRFVDDGNDFRRGPDQLGGVKNDGVIIMLGPIEAKKDRVQVPNTLWCGGLCAQWLTYVLSNKDGRWVITGTTGPAAIS